MIKYLKETDIKYGNVKEMSIQEIKEKVIEWDTKQWKKEMEEKTTLYIYRKWKNQMGKMEEVYDNRPSSVTLFKARTNNLPLNDRQRFGAGNINCDLCDAEREDLKHFLLECPEYGTIRERVEILERGNGEHQGDEDRIGKFLFQSESWEDTKQTLQEMWKRRERKRKEIIRHRINL
jgi:hypothetical protein